MTSIAEGTRQAQIRKHLNEITRSLNGLRDLGVRVSARHGALITDYGFLIPTDEGTWEPKFKLCDPQMRPVGDPDDD